MQTQTSPSQKQRQNQSKPKKPRNNKFSDTKLGWLILKESPVLYEVITGICKLPSKDLLRSLAISSDEPFFRTDQFWTELVKYRPDRIWKPSVEEELERIRGGVYNHSEIKRKLSHN